MIPSLRNLASPLDATAVASPPLPPGATATPFPIRPGSHSIRAQVPTACRRCHGRPATAENRSGLCASCSELMADFAADVEAER